MKLRPLLIPTLFVGLALFLADSARADDFSSAVRAGNKSYGKQDYESAMRHYQDAEIERPEAPTLHYNIANTLYEQERYEEAVQRYNKAFYTEDPNLEAHAYYNQGNALYRAGKLAEAIQAYEKCLDLNPDDVDAKYNLEFVRKKLKEMMDQQKQEEKQQGQQQEKQEGQPQKQQPGEESEKKQDQSQSAQREEEQPQADSTQAQPQIQPEPQEGMSREEAERILNALKSDEKELLEDQRRFKGRSRRVTKDW
jgi:Ca-activated chloride channel family protein